MNVAHLIAQKRDGETLTEKDIRALIEGFTNGDVPEYQMSAFAMAVYFQNMTPEETTWLTQAMVDSGDTLKWSAAKPSVDKHSTGGIGDKISIPLAPLLACCDVEVPMISGRGLGMTGGTLDKLESIPGYRTGLSVDEFASVINWNGCSIASASEKVAPADRKLYALRDVTGTVPSIPPDHREHPFEKNSRRHRRAGAGCQMGQRRFYENVGRCPGVGNFTGYRWQSIRS